MSRKVILPFILAMVLLQFTIMPLAVGAQADWPEVEGLAFDAEKGIYAYLAGNPYGGVEGETAGKVKPEVYVNEEKKGGISFQYDVYKFLFEKALAEIPEGEPKLISIVPLDIKDYEGKLTISDSYLTRSDNYDHPMLMITCNSEVDLVNTNLYSEKYNFGYIKLKERTMSFVFDVFCLMFVRGGEFNNSQAYKYRQIMLSGDELSKGDEFKCSFGDKILTKNKNTEIYIVGIETKTKENRIKINSFLEVAGKIVFPNVNEIYTSIDSSQYKTLSAGYTGPEVATLKQRMYELGYFTNNVVNETFTTHTAEYVKEFERVNGLPVDGIADSEMLELFYSDRAIRKPKD